MQELGIQWENSEEIWTGHTTNSNFHRRFRTSFLLFDSAEQLFLSPTSFLLLQAETMPPSNMLLLAGELSHEVLGKENWAGGVQKLASCHLVWRQGGPQTTRESEIMCEAQILVSRCKILSYT